MACVVDFVEVALRARGIGPARSFGAARVADLALRVGGIARTLRGSALLVTFGAPMEALLLLANRAHNPPTFTVHLLTSESTFARALLATLELMEALLLLANAATTIDNVAGLRSTRSVAQRAAASLQRGEVFVQPCWLSSEAQLDVEPVRLTMRPCPHIPASTHTPAHPHTYLPTHTCQPTHLPTHMPTHAPS